MGIGYSKGETCGRDGCIGVLDEYEKDGGCSCHINPPCSYCTTDTAFCPVCGYDARSEQIEEEKALSEYYKKMEPIWAEERRKVTEERDLFYKMYRGEIPAPCFKCRRESHTHFTMRVFAVFPKGYDFNEVLQQVRGTFGGRIVRRNETSIEYIAYTD